MTHEERTSTGADSRRLAVWSGPRNISTALMRAWENRGDTAVCDEPFYAHYLLKTGKSHPGAQEVIAGQENDWRKVVEFLSGPVPDGKPIFYQKHMAHHLLPDMGRDWLPGLTHCFLVRQPREMLASLDEKLEEVRLEDTGLPQQLEIFESVRRRTGTPPPVVDSRDVLEAPEAVLRRLCDAVDVRFTSKMLTWPPGRRNTDGVWARFWYDSVEKSTGFAPYRPREGTLPAHLERLHDECMEYYETLYAYRLAP